MMNELTEKQKGEFFELPVEMGIFVPSTKNASVPVSESEFESRVKQVEDFVAKMFGGFSSFDDIQGGYYSDDLKEVIREEVKEVRFFANAGAFQENIKGLLNQITLWCLEWGQEAIGFEIEGDLFYVGANSKIYRYGGETYANGGVTLSHVDVSMAPMGERTQVGSEGDTYLGENAFLYAKGGRVKLFEEKDSFRYVPYNSIEKEYLLRVAPFLKNNEFAGNIYIKGNRNDFYLYELDSFDKNFLEEQKSKIKDDERVFRYISRTTAIGGMAPLIKINLGKQLCYFNEAEDESVKWTTRGLPIEYINLREDLKFEKGGQVDYSREMIKSQNKEIAHHSSELSSVLDKYKKMSVEPWVIAKLERATTDLSDVTHYLDGKEGKDYYAKGGSVKNINMPKVGSEVSARWNDDMQWATGIFIGETKNGFEVYDFSIEQPKYIEFYGEISTDPYNGSEIFKSNKFKDRNYKNYHFTKQDEKYAKGGDIPVKIVNKGKTYDKSNYKAIYGDFDKDGLMNSDDPNPIKKGDKRRVEQLSFPKIFDTLLDTKGKLDSTMYDAVATLKKITPDGGKIYARTKTPYSIINKLIDSRMIVPKDPKKGLTDMVGTTIVVDNVEDVMRVQKEIESGALGEILPEGYDKNGNVILADDKYKNPKGGYRAIHYIVIMDGIPVEVQLKTMRMKEINELAHPHYKAKNLNSDYMNYLTDLADKGDRGDVKAQREFNSIMRNKKNVSEKLKLDSTYMYAMGGRVEEIYGDEMDLDGIFEDFKED